MSFFDVQWEHFSTSILCQVKKRLLPARVKRNNFHQKVNNLGNTNGSRYDWVWECQNWAWSIRTKKGRISRTVLITPGRVQWTRIADGFKTQTDIDDSAMKDFKLICNKGIEYKILDGMKYFDVECWAKIANVSGTGKVRVYIQWILADIIQNGHLIWWSK